MVRGNGVTSHCSFEEEVEARPHSAAGLEQRFIRLMSRQRGWLEVTQLIEKNI